MEASENAGAPSRREPSSLLPGLNSRGAGAAARALRGVRAGVGARFLACEGPAELAKPPRPLRPATRGPGKLRERQLRAAGPLPTHRARAHGLRHLQPPGKRIHRGQGSGEKARPAGPGGREGHRRAGELAVGLFSSLQSAATSGRASRRARGSKTRRPTALLVTTPGP